MNIIIKFMNSFVKCMLEDIYHYYLLSEDKFINVIYIRSAYWQTFI
mgnify:CR=1 FL=1